MRDWQVASRQDMGESRRYEGVVGDIQLRHTRPGDLISVFKVI